jgi:D-serine deaminase-like pyridoxal phosphate-dependent protein
LVQTHPAPAERRATLRDTRPLSNGCAMTDPHLYDLPTPALILDLDRIERNCERMMARAAELGVKLRPHMKTAKSADVARLATRRQSVGITVSTLAEIEYFAEAGFDDITYAVGIAGHKIPALADLQRRFGIRITLLTDTVQAVHDVAERAEMLGEQFAVFIEIDCGGGRGGVLAGAPDLLLIAQALQASPMLSLAGVLTHAGQSYDATSMAAIVEIAETERAAVTHAAKRLQAAGIEVRSVSVGSTPTALYAASLAGVTEMRPGVYTLFDLAQVSLGTCTIDDIAVSVLATVIGHNPRSRRMLIDAGALALSKDLSASKLGANTGYGLVCPMSGGPPIGGTYVAEVNQEHGLITGPDVGEGIADRFPVGTRVRILPNHACLTAAPYGLYHVVRGENTRVQAVWPKATGW